jgi:hypothetical protein
MLLRFCPARSPAREAVHIPTPKHLESLLRLSNSKGQIMSAGFPRGDGEGQLLPPPLARVDGLAPPIMKCPMVGRQTIFLGKTEPRAARPERYPPRGLSN